MDWMNQISGLLQQYQNAQPHQAPESVEHDFDRFAQHAPQSALADALSAAFRSEQTPAFGQMASQLFGQATGQQRAGILNTLIATLGPAVVSQILSRQGGSGLAGLLGSGQTQVTPEQAEQVSPETLQGIADAAAQQDPSVIDSLSNVYAQHPTLIKTLGGAALTIALAKIAQRQYGG